MQESDPTEAQGVYAKSKLQADQHVQAQSKDYVVIRTSWVYSSFGNNFVKTMMRLGKDRDALSIVSDQIGTPSYAADIASAIMHVIKYRIDHPNEDLNGIYNFSNSGVTNWAEFAEAIFKKCELKVDVTPITTEDFGAPAPRPKWSLMNKEKITNRFGLKLIAWEDSLYKCIDILNAKAE